MEKLLRYYKQSVTSLSGEDLSVTTIITVKTRSTMTLRHDAIRNSQNTKGEENL